MRRYGLLIAITPLIGTPALSQPPIPSGGERPTIKQTETQSNRKLTAEDQGGAQGTTPVKVINAPNSPAQTDTAKQQSLEKAPPDWWSPEWSVVWATLGLILVGSLQVGMFFKQLRYMHDSMADAKIAAEAAKEPADALAAAQRAFVYVSRFNFGRVYMAESYWFGPQWRNSGATPTTNLRTHVRVEAMDIKIPDTFNFNYPAVANESLVPSLVRAQT